MSRVVPIVVGVVALTTAGCRDEAPKGRDGGAQRPPPQAAAHGGQGRTVLAFLENTALLDETFALCRNDPGGLGLTPDCQNAGHAKERLMMLGRDRAIQSLKR